MNAAPIEIGMDAFIEQASAWLQRNATPRHGRESERPRAWGEGDFNVAVFHNLSFDEEKQILDDLVAWNTRKRPLGYHAVDWPVEFGGLGLTKGGVPRSGGPLIWLAAASPGRRVRWAGSSGHRA